MAKCYLQKVEEKGVWNPFTNEGKLRNLDCEHQVLLILNAVNIIKNFTIKGKINENIININLYTLDYMATKSVTQNLLNSRNQM